MSGFRKSHSTTTILLKLRDDIIKAMNRGEITMAIFADYSKAFDTVNYSTILQNLINLGFEKSSVKLICSYLCERRQYVQVNDKSSQRKLVEFGVPQGSVLGPILFNLYVSDLQNLIETNICQYADDTTCYENFRPSQLNQNTSKLEKVMHDMLQYAKSKNMIFNLDKTKSMLFATKRMYDHHNLSDINAYKITVDNGSIERVRNWKVLGVNFDENLSWKVHINEVVKSCFAKLSVLRKLKRYANYNRRKQLAETLVLSKLDYALPLLSNANQIEINRLQKVLRSAASFVTYRYSRTSDVINLRWIPMKEQIDYYQLKLAHKAIYDETFPEYLKLTFKSRDVRLRNVYECTLPSNMETTTFKGSISKIFNDLPVNLRSEKKYKTFSRLVKQYQLDLAFARNISNT